MYNAPIYVYIIKYSYLIVILVVAGILKSMLYNKKIIIELLKRM
jgi:hypothetical protein